MAATAPDDIMACLRRLEEGQARIETKLAKMDMHSIAWTTAAPATVPPVKEQLRNQTSKMAIPDIFQDVKPATATVESTNDENAGADLTENKPDTSATEGQTHEDKLSEDVLVKQEDPKVAKKSKAHLMQDHYQKLLEHHAGAHKALFEARNQARGWLQNKQVLDEDNQEDGEDGSAPLCSSFSKYEELVRKYIDNGTFDIVFGTIIFANAMVMVVRIEQQGQEIGHQEKLDYQGLLVDRKAEAPSFHVSGNTYWAVELIFMIIFTIELLLRLWVRGWVFFRIGWNILDFVLVAVTYLDQFFKSFPVDVTLFRLLRLVRLAKVLRVIRMLRCFKALRVLCATLANSMIALVWSTLLLGAILLMSSCLLSAALQPTIEDGSVNDLLRADIWRKYGTIGHSFWTLFRWTLSASWTGDIEDLMLGVHPLWALFAIPYIVVVNFALTRIVAALFIKETFAIAARDTDAVLEEAMRKDGKTVHVLKDIFDKFDHNGSGDLNREEFLAAMSDPRLKLTLKNLEIAPHEAGSLFTLLDNGTGQISCEELVTGAMGLRGDAKAVDIATVMYENQKTMLVVRSIEQLCQMLVKFAQHTMEQLDEVKDDTTGMKAVGNPFESSI